MMIFRSKRKGSNLVEYGLLAVLVGAVIGASMMAMDDNTISGFFRGAFTDSNENAGTVSLDPLTE